ncbi:uncharacterized protein TNCV_4459321 [Trichonephila clavipes]|nr:uncharacterized protein TNCV_4459321 [Trichonephila clavipes]
MCPKRLYPVCLETVVPVADETVTCRNCGGGDRGRVAIYRPFGEISLSLNRTVTCMVLKANDRRTSCPCHDEFRGPRSDYVRQTCTVHNFWPILQILDGASAVCQNLDTVLIRVESMIESTTNSMEFRSKDGTMVKIPDADFNIIPRSVTKNTTPCSDEF